MPILAYINIFIYIKCYRFINHITSHLSHCVVLKLYEKRYVKCWAPYPAHPKWSMNIIYPNVPRIRHFHREEGFLDLSETVLSSGLSSSWVLWANGFFFPCTFCETWNCIHIPIGSWQAQSQKYWSTSGMNTIVFQSY